MLYQRRAGVGLAAVLLFLIAGRVVAAEKSNPPPRMSMRIKAKATMKLPDGTEIELDADTSFIYSWRHKQDTAELILHAMKVCAVQDGRELMNVAMSRSAFRIRQAGKWTNTPFDEAPPRLQQILKDTFETPFCELKLAADGRELSRKTIAAPGAKLALDSGAIDVARIFHPPFPDKDEWAAPAKFPRGIKKGYTKGTLHYKRAKKDARAKKKDKLVEVTVSGDLKGDAKQGPIEIRISQFKVTGRQTYDTSRRRWIAGRMDVKTTMEMYMGDKKFSTVDGTIQTELAEEKTTVEEPQQPLTASEPQQPGIEETIDITEPVRSKPSADAKTQ